MKQKRKSKALTFIFSFLPGAAEMYMGFMKNGLTLMMLFFLAFAPIVFFSALDVLSVIGVILWFYGFFHARNYASMTDEEFYSMEDKYIWEEFGDFKKVNVQANTLKKWVAAILIIVGVAQLWNYVYELVVRLIPESYWDYAYPFVEDLPQVAIAILFVVIGIRMILGKKRELIEEESSFDGKLIAEIPQKPADNTSESKEA